MAFIIGLSNPAESVLAELHQVMLKTGQIIQRYLPFSVSTGIGQPVNQLVLISQSYSQALVAAEYRLTRGSSAVIAYEAILAQQQLMPDYPAEAETEIIQAVRNRNSAKAREALNSFLAQIAPGNVDAINMALSQLSISLNRILQSLKISQAVKSKFSYRVQSTRLADCDFLDQKKALLLEFCEALIESRNDEIQSKKGELVDHICRYVQSDLANPLLDIKMLADYAGLSSSYLRAVFKEITGQSPNDYITTCRIEKAKQLLLQTDHATKDIALAVGYLNHRYFYSVFKNKVGCTATAFRDAERRQPQENKEHV